MAKIKSTIDLVMERTKNLNMTDADKEKLKTKEGLNKVRAWLRKYLDGKINADEMRRNLDAHKETFPEVVGLLKKELVSLIRSEGDNKKILQALARVFDIREESIEEFTAFYKKQLESKMSRCVEQAGSDLKKQGIYGASVVPNIKKSTQWQESLLQAQEDFAHRIITFIDTETSSP